MDQPVLMIAALAILSVLPFLLVMLTSFVKIAVVLSIVRNAMGAANIPPTMVITGMALVLTLFIMAPVGQRVYAAVEPAIAGDTGNARETAATFIEAGKAAREPVREFLEKHAHTRDRAMFADLALRMGNEGATDRDLLVLAPSFVTSELKEAFAIGFLLFIPFLILDVVVSNVLLSLGMHMMSPTTVSLPFKLLLFVMVDGWFLLSRGLVLGYA